MGGALSGRGRVSVKHTQHTVFVSYAREDHDWVSVAADLLNAGGAKVFMDVRNTASGGRWKDVLKSTLQPAERVLVFWSRHAAASGWVQQECRVALRHGKRVVLVPMDDTPLTSVLWQSRPLTDLKALLRQGAAPTRPARPSSASRYAAFAGFSILGLLLALPVLLSPVDLSFRTFSPDGDPGLYPLLAGPAFLWALAAATSVLLAAFVWLRLLHVRKQKRKRAIRRRLDSYVSPQDVGKPAGTASDSGGLGKQVVDMVFDEYDLSNAA